MDHNRKLYIETVGCQMNELDSELVVAALRREGYELTADVHEADTVLFNTCSVREHAEHKIYSQLGRLRHSKKRRPKQVIGVMGCMAQKDQELIFQRAPHVDLVVGTGQLSEIPRLISESRANRQRAVAVSLSRNEGSRVEVSESFQSYDPLREPEMRPSPFQAYVRIMLGCDKFCTYCVVPMTRGPEQSRPPEPDCRRSPSVGRPGRKRSHPARADRQQLQARGTRPPLPVKRSVGFDPRHAGHSADQVRHELPARHDGRFAVRCPRLAQGLPLPARARPVGFR